jgi:hypothetical protein
MPRDETLQRAIEQAGGALPLPGETLRTIFDHVSRTGAPLLRERRADDAYVVAAWDQSDGTYELVDADDHDDVCSLESWESIADYAGLDLPTLVRELEARGYRWGLPHPDDPEDCWPAPEPFDAAALLQGFRTGRTLWESLSEVPSTVTWDRATPHPGVPANPTETIAWGELGTLELYQDDVTVFRGGDHDTITQAPSPLALSLLQAAFDHAGARTWVQLGSWAVQG